MTQQPLYTIINTWPTAETIYQRGQTAALTIEQKKEIAAAYTAGETSLSLTKRYGVCRETICKALREMGANKANAEACRKYPVNVHLFEHLDCEQAAYWMGFLGADGCVVGSSITLSLKRSDGYHIERFRDWIAPLNPVRTYSYTSTSRIAIWSKRLVEIVAEHGLVPRKSSILNNRPSSLPPAMVRHYYRGYIDGDGWLTIPSEGDDRERAQSTYIGLCGTEQFLTQFAQWVCTETEITLRPPRKWTNHCTIGKGGIVSVSRIANLLYAESNISLDRKHNKYREIMSLEERYSYRNKNRDPRAVCYRGHPRTAENLYTQSRGFVGCRACDRESQRRYLDKRKGVVDAR